MQKQTISKPIPRKRKKLKKKIQHKILITTAHNIMTKENLKRKKHRGRKIASARIGYEGAIGGATILKK